MRGKSGRFIKGHSGNAGGRPKDEHNISALARSYSMEAIETPVELMRNARDDRVRGTAAQALLDRGFGKPKVEIQNTNADLCMRFAKGYSSNFILAACCLLLHQQTDFYQ
jgi:HEPN domain-containing protein